MPRRRARVLRMLPAVLRDRPRKSGEGASMTGPAERPDARGEREAHVRRLRIRAITVALVCFVLLLGALTVRLANGEDPALGASTVTRSESRPEEVQPEDETSEVEPLTTGQS